MSDYRPILTVAGLRTHFFTRAGIVRAVDGVGFAIATDQTFALVGESACGKSVTAYSILRLITPPGRIVSGRITLSRDGRQTVLTDLPDDGRAIRRIRGKEIAIIFQEPMTSLSPVHRVGDQILEAVRLHSGMGRSAARAVCRSSRAALAALAATQGVPGPSARCR